MARKTSTRKTTVGKTRRRQTKGISEREVFIGVIVLAVVLVIIQAISDFFNRFPWVGWILLFVVIAIAAYAAVRFIKTKL